MRTLRLKHYLSTLTTTKINSWWSEISNKTINDTYGTNFDKILINKIIQITHNIKDLIVLDLAGDVVYTDGNPLVPVEIDTQLNGVVKHAIEAIANSKASSFLVEDNSNGKKVNAVTSDGYVTTGVSGSSMDNGRTNKASYSYDYLSISQEQNKVLQSFLKVFERMKWEFSQHLLSNLNSYQFKFMNSEEGEPLFWIAQPILIMDNLEHQYQGTIWKDEDDIVSVDYSTYNNPSWAKINDSGLFEIMVAEQKISGDYTFSFDLKSSKYGTSQKYTIEILMDNRWDLTKLPDYYGYVASQPTPLQISQWIKDFYGSKLSTDTIANNITIEMFDNYFNVKANENSLFFINSKEYIQFETSTDLSNIFQTRSVWVIPPYTAEKVREQLPATEQDVFTSPHITLSWDEDAQILTLTPTSGDETYTGTVQIEVNYDTDLINILTNTDLGMINVFSGEEIVGRVNFLNHTNLRYAIDVDYEVDYDLNQILIKGLAPNSGRYFNNVVFTFTYAIAPTITGAEMITSAGSYQYTSNEDVTWSTSALPDGVDMQDITYRSMSLVVSKGKQVPITIIATSLNTGATATKVVWLNIDYPTPTITCTCGGTNISAGSTITQDNITLTFSCINGEFNEIQLPSDVYISSSYIGSTTFQMIVDITHVNFKQTINVIASNPDKSASFTLNFNISKTPVLNFERTFPYHMISRNGASPSLGNTNNDYTALNFRCWISDTDDSSAWNGGQGNCMNLEVNQDYANHYMLRCIPQGSRYFNLETGVKSEPEQWNYQAILLSSDLRIRWGIKHNNDDNDNWYSGYHEDIVGTNEYLGFNSTDNSVTLQLLNNGYLGVYGVLDNVTVESWDEGGGTNWDPAFAVEGGSFHLQVYRFRKT